ncbi:DUF6531 domain-containing protein [Streptomyces sp. NPDC058221]|uniref:DUF6531 domain-containing protein n=1 Tax=Streptomyces sp. NPDC058221 TaxID=3346388 RepID=UPI0036F05A21
MAFWMAAASVWGVLQLLLLSWPVRTVRWPTVLLALGVGAYGSGVASVLVELFVARRLADSEGSSLHDVLGTVMWTTAPVAEELLKIAPLLLAGWALRGRMQWGMADFAVLGGAVGAGFGLLEAVAQYALAPDAVVRPVEGGWMVGSGFSAPFVAGFPELLGHWFPAPVGTVALGSFDVSSTAEQHVVWSVLGGLGVGLFLLGRTWWVRFAGLVPLALAIAQHMVVNYAADQQGSDGWQPAWYDRLAAAGWWTVLVCLALAVLWDIRAGRRGKRLEPGVLLAAERDGTPAGAALLNFALLRLPWTAVAVLGYARQRRALLYAAVHPRIRPERLSALRELVARQTQQMNAATSDAAWKGIGVRQVWQQLRARRGRWPWWEKVLLVVGVLLLIPAGVLMAVRAFPWAKDWEESFTTGTGWHLLVAAGLTGLLLGFVRLVLAVCGLRAARLEVLAERHAASMLRVVSLTGALLAGAWLWSRSGHFPPEGGVFDEYHSATFLLEKIVQLAPVLLMALLMFSGPFGMPLELLLGESIMGDLLMMAGSRLLAPVAERVAVRIAEREAMAWARNAARRGHGLFSRTWERIRHGRTDPVDLATGRMFLPQADIELPGVLPLVFARRADSGYRGGRWFGPGWASTADQRLEFDEQGVIFFTENGLLLAYPHPAPGREVLPEDGPRLPLLRAADGTYTVTDRETGHVRTFAPHSEGPALLTELADRNGNRITFSYAADGTPLEIRHSGGYCLRLTTADGRITALQLDDIPVMGYGYAAGHLSETTNSTGLPLRFTNDPAGRITAWTDTNNRSYTYTYDEQDRVVAEGGEGGHFTLHLAYDGTHPDFPGLKTTTLTSANGAVSHSLIDHRHLVVAEIDPNGAITRTSYDEAGRTVSETDALGRTTHVAYDSDGRLSHLVRPDGSSFSVFRDAQGNPVETTSPDGSVWQQKFDVRGNLTAITDPLGATSRYFYDARGGLIAVTNPLGATTRVRCDAAGLPAEITDALGATTHLHRDAFGRIAAETDPLGATTRYRWSVEGHLLGRTAADGTGESWAYDGEGNCLTHTDANGGVTSHEYTHFDLLTARTDPDGVRYTFAYDAEARLTRVTNPQGLTWDYRHDPAGRLISETDFDGRTITYAHDLVGQLVTLTNALGQQTTYTHDELGHLTEQKSAGRTSVFRWTESGQLHRATGPDTELVRHYDPAGRMTSETVEGHTLNLTYDIAGQLITRRTPAGVETSYTYDAAGGRSSLQTLDGEVAADHDAAGRTSHRRWSNGLSMVRSRDAAGRTIGDSYSVPEHHTPLLERAYSWRPDGYLAGINDSISGPRRHTLTASGRVTRIDANNWTESYAYDPAGNQTYGNWPSGHAYAEAIGERTYSGTRIQSAGKIRYEHDAAGRTTLRQKPRLSAKPDTWHYTWDTEDRLSQAVTPDGATWRYGYDPLGRRITKQRLGAEGMVAEETRFTWHGTSLIEQTATSTVWPGTETVTWDHDESGLTPLTQTRRYTPAEGVPQSEVDHRFYAIVTDLVGTPTHLIDEDGEIAWEQRSTVWGTTTWPLEASAYTPLRFPGQYHDLETGHHYNLHRYYDPESARYLNPDPLGLSPAPNPITYVANPHTWSDPRGLAPYLNSHLSDLPVHRNPNRFYARAGELVNNRIASHPLTDAQMYGGDLVGHGGVRNLPTRDILRYGGPRGDDPISGYRDWALNDTRLFPGSRIHITGGHHRTAEIVRRLNRGDIAPETLIEFFIRR